MTVKAAAKFAVIILPIVMLVGCAVSGPEVPSWSNYPAHALVPADSVIGAPTETDITERSKRVLEQVRAELADRYGVDNWEEQFKATWQPFDSNGYGGKSLLAAYTSSTWEAPVELPKSSWSDIISLVTEIASENDLTAMSDEGESKSEWMAHGSFQDGLFYIEVVVQDARLNTEELELAQAEGLLVSGIALSSGGTTVRDPDWKEFTDRAKAFDGLDLPPATSD